MNKNNPKARNENIVVQDFENEVLIYDLKDNKAYCLNETSAKIFHLCDGKNSITEIANLLSSQMNEPITEDFVWLALDGLKKEKLLEESEKFEIDFNGLNRRQVIRKIGFASLAALPVIASVTAPAAGAAASFCLTAVNNVCMMGGTEACPPSCPPGTPLMGTLYGTMDGTCSGVVGSFSGGCPSGPIFFDYRVEF